MTSSPLLQRFVDDELVGAALLLQQVVESVGEHGVPSGIHLSAAERAAAADVIRALPAHRAALAERYTGALREQVAATLAVFAGTRQLSRMAAGVGQPLALMDEAEVATDVALSRTIAAIESTAEYELRELQAYTAALVGDARVSRVTNPFNAENHAQALWAAAQVLPMSPLHRLEFMRLAAMPLARELRKAYAAACTRLEGEGIEPAIYATVILTPGRVVDLAPDSETPTTIPTDLNRLRDSMPMPLSARDEAAAAVAASRRAGIDPQLVELLSRLFDAIVAKKDLPSEVRMLLGRLHTPLLRLAMRDSRVLDAYEHPAWTFIDRVVFHVTGAHHDTADRQAFLAYATRLIDDLTGQATRRADGFGWCLERITAYERHRLDQRRQALAADIAALQVVAHETRPEGSPPGPPAAAPSPAMDVGSLDTVPADLLELARRAGPGSALQAHTWLEQRVAGDWLRVFLQGGWTTAQVVWRDDAGEVWLLAPADGQPPAGLRRRAMELLRAEGLMQACTPLSLIEYAADRVLRDLSGAPT